MIAKRFRQTIGTLCGALLLHHAGAATVGYVVAQPVSLNVSGQPITLAAGQSVSVLGVSNGMAMIKVVLPNGSLSITQIPLANLQQKTIQPVTAATPTSSPSPSPVAQPAQPTPQANTAQPGTPPAPGQKPEDQDVVIAAKELKAVAGAVYSAQDQTLAIAGDGAGFQWNGAVPQPGAYQVWVTYYCGDKKAAATLQANGLEKTKPLLYMGPETIERFYGTDDTPITNGTPPQPYYFREYWGTFALGANNNLKMTYRGGREIRVQSMEFNRLKRHQEDLAPLLNGAIGFYECGTPANGLTSDVFNPLTQKAEPVASIAVCGIALAAFSISHDIGREPEESRRRALDLLRAANGKMPGIRLSRHESGLFQHFVNRTTGESGKSEFSTIDTAILVSGALMARNVFHDPEITAEADALWNSIDWSRCVIKEDPAKPRFYFTGADMDTFKEEKDLDKIRGTVMFNEYILLAYFCQQHENMKHPSGPKRTIMPDLQQLPKKVFRNRILLDRTVQPSFIVQFPFFMSDMCTDELYFSYVAAQGVADRSYNTEKFKDRSAWGVSAGWTPSKAYSVPNFLRNPDNVVSPPIVAGFMPVLPLAADDLFHLYQKPDSRQQLQFGEILPQYVPETDLKSNRIPAVDFSVWLYGLAWNHPKLGPEWFAKNTRFTFK